MNLAIIHDDLQRIEVALYLCILFCALESLVLIYIFKILDEGGNMAKQAKPKQSASKPQAKKPAAKAKKG